jgi:chemotaxis protein MotD
MSRFDAAMPTDAGRVELGRAAARTSGAAEGAASTGDGETFAALFRELSTAAARLPVRDRPDPQSRHTNKPAAMPDEPHGEGASGAGESKAPEHAASGSDPLTLPSGRENLAPVPGITLLSAGHEALPIAAAEDRREGYARPVVGHTGDDLKHGRDLPSQPIARIKVAVLDRQTHFAPVIPGAAGAPANVVAGTDTAPLGTDTATQAFTNEAASIAKRAATMRNGVEPPGATPRGTPISPPGPFTPNVAALNVAGQPGASASASPVPAIENALRASSAPGSAQTEPKIEGAGDSDAHSHDSRLEPRVGTARRDAGHREWETSTDRGRSEPNTTGETGAGGRLQETAGSATPAQSGLPATELRRVAAAIAEVAQAAPRSAPTTEPSLSAASGLKEPVRMLTIQLQPEDLGRVEVRLRLQGNALSMQLRASNETVRLLEQDRQALTELLRTSGYETETLAIRADVAEPFRPVTAGPDLTGTQTAATRPDSGAASGREQYEGQRDGGSGAQSRDGDTPKGNPRNAEANSESVLRSDLYV